MTRARNPVIAGTLTWLDCKIVAEYQAGDHYIVIGQVIE
jgi:flavin reductase (DIM6/NTAB) family NADH-FMN oxidoreductase RutF